MPKCCEQITECSKSKSERYTLPELVKAVDQKDLTFLIRRAAWPATEVIRGFGQGRTLLDRYECQINVDTWMDIGDKKPYLLSTDDLAANDWVIVDKYETFFAKKFKGKKDVVFFSKWLQYDATCFNIYEREATPEETETFWEDYNETLEPCKA